MNMIYEKYMESLDDSADGFLGSKSLSDFLYEKYTEVSPLEDDEAKEYYRQLEVLSGKLSLEDNNALFSEIVAFCILYAKAYFTCGLQVGIHFRSEIVPVLRDPPVSPVPAYGRWFQTYLSNLSPSASEQNTMTDLLRDCYMAKEFSASQPAANQIHRIIERMHKKRIHHRDTLNLVTHLAVRYACRGFEAGFQTGLQLESEYTALIQSRWVF